VTLKIRTGWDTQHKNGVRIAMLAEQAGIQSLAVHGRTRACRFKGPAEYATIAEIRRAVQIPLIANGDIRDSKKSLEVMQLTGADALMIGRGAQGRPWIFRQLNSFFDDEKNCAPLEKKEVRDIMLDHLSDLYRFYGERTGVRIARKHLVWYCNGLRDSAEFRSQVVRVDSAKAQTDLTLAYFRRQDSKELLAA